MDGVQMCWVEWVRVVCDMIRLNCAKLGWFGWGVGWFGRLWIQGILLCEANFPPQESLSDLCGRSGPWLSVSLYPVLIALNCAYLNPLVSPSLYIEFLWFLI